MSGIFKGDSIYKSGGGSGGGYKDGGELVDGDFIKVENNTVSTYTNLTRNEINYYIEIENDEIPNSNIELNTSVAATINVYVVRNGLFIPIGYVGSNTVNVGNYTIVICGNSFEIEEVEDPPTDIDAAIIGGEIYRTKVYGSTLWTIENLTIIPSGVNTNPTSGKNDNPNVWINGGNPKNVVYNFFAAKKLVDSLNGWELPLKTDVDALLALIAPNGNSDVNHFKSTTFWRNENGDNSSGFNAYPYGEVDSPVYNAVWYNLQDRAFFWAINNPAGDERNYAYGCYSSSFSTGMTDNRKGLSVRLIKRL